MYEILDDFRSPVDTRVAEPIVDQQPQGAITWIDDGSEEREQNERWPDASIPFDVWSSRSVMAFHCSWMLTQESIMHYVVAYWNKLNRLPALGHLHFVYNNPFSPTSDYVWMHTQSSPMADEAHDILAPADLCVCDCAFFTKDEVPPTNGCLELLRRMLHLVSDRWPVCSPSFDKRDSFAYRSKCWRTFSLFFLSVSRWNHRRVYACSWPQDQIHELLVPLRRSISLGWPRTMLEQFGVCRDFKADEIIWHFLRENTSLLSGIPKWVLALIGGGRLHPPTVADGKKIKFHFQLALPDAEPAVWTAIRTTSVSNWENEGDETMQIMRVVVFVHEWPDQPARQLLYAGAMTDQATHADGPVCRLSSC